MKIIDNFSRKIRNIYFQIPYLLLGSKIVELLKDNGIVGMFRSIANEEIKLPYMSVCMPTHEMRGYDGFLRHSLDMFVAQSFKDFEIIISDHSKTNGIKNICKEYSDKINIRYFRNPKGPYTSSANLNNAIQRARGKIIKIIFLDDYLYHKDSLKDIVDNFDINKDYWLVTASEHTRDGINYYMPYYPKYNDKIHLGDNTISSPSVLTIKNDTPLLFDRRMIWLMDVDYYRRLYDKFGPPVILNKINVVNRTGEHQVSNTSAGKNIRGLEYRWVLKKFGEKDLLKIYDNRKPIKLNLSNVTLVVVGKYARMIAFISSDGIDFSKTIYTENIDDQINIDTDFALYVSRQGFVISAYKWKEEFLNYDLIGDESMTLRSKKYINGNRENIRVADKNMFNGFGVYKYNLFLLYVLWFKKYIKSIKFFKKIFRLYSIGKNGH